MALDRLFSLYRSGLSDTSPVKVWATPTERSAIVSTFDPSVGTPIESVVLRLRDRDDLTLSSVLTDDDGNIWIPSEIHHVGRHRFLDVAVTHYVGAALTITPDLPVTQNYMPQAGYTVTKDGAAVQNWIVASITPVFERQRWVYFRVRSVAAAGAWFPSRRQSARWDPLKVRIIGDVSNTQRDMQVDTFGAVAPEDPLRILPYAMTTEETVFPSFGTDAFFLTDTTLAALAVGGAIRILSRDEITG